MFIPHQHPKTGILMSGIKLAPGAVLCAEDVYDSTNGGWEPCPVPGLLLGNTSTLWVRPRNLTQNEQDLLGYLASQPLGSSTCIAKKTPGIQRFLVVPSPDYNWDTRIETPPVIHPECIQPLLDVGFLMKDPVNHDHDVEFYVMTDTGRTVAARLAA